MCQLRALWFEEAGLTRRRSLKKRKLLQVIPRRGQRRNPWKGKFLQNILMRVQRRKPGEEEEVPAEDPYADSEEEEVPAETQYRDVLRALDTGLSSEFWDIVSGYELETECRGRDRDGAAGCGRWGVSTVRMVELVFEMRSGKYEA